MSRFSTLKVIVILVLSRSTFDPDSYDENRFKIGQKVSELQLGKLGNPRKKSFEKKALKVQQNGTKQRQCNKEKRL